MKIFITGGSGFVGGAFIKAYGYTHEIIAMSRSEKSDAKLIPLGAKPIRCSLGKITPSHLQGCEIVMHCAAYVGEWGPWANYEAANVDGTQQILDAAREAGVKRFVHMSTESTLFYGQHMREIDETAPLALTSPFPYSRTKAYAEKLVTEANDAENGFTTISLRPRMIWGPDDQTIMAAVKDMALAGKFMWIDGGKAITSTTHIANLISAMEIALTKGKGGEAYFILDEGHISIRDFLSSYLATQGVDLGTKSVPGLLVRGLANLTEPIWRALKSTSPPPATKFAANIMSKDCTLIGTKARTELGYRPVISRDVGFAQLQKN